MFFSYSSTSDGTVHTPLNCLLTHWRNPTFLSLHTFGCRYDSDFIDDRALGVRRARGDKRRGERTSLATHDTSVSGENIQAIYARDMMNSPDDRGTTFYPLVFVSFPLFFFSSSFPPLVIPLLARMAQTAARGMQPVAFEPCSAFDVRAA